MPEHDAPNIFSLFLKSLNFSFFFFCFWLFHCQNFSFSLLIYIYILDLIKRCNLNWGARWDVYNKVHAVRQFGLRTFSQEPSPQWDSSYHWIFANLGLKRSGRCGSWVNGLGLGVLSYRLWYASRLLLYLQPTQQSSHLLKYGPRLAKRWISWPWHGLASLSKWISSIGGRWRGKLSDDKCRVSLTAYDMKWERHQHGITSLFSLAL